MKKILKEGKKEVVEFECDECEAKFATDEYLYHEVPKVFSENGLYIFLECECGNKISKTIR